MEIRISIRKVNHVYMSIIKLDFSPSEIAGVSLFYYRSIYFSKDRHH